MFKRDEIFWIAAILFLISIVLAVSTGEQLWLFLMIASYLIRPTLASLGITRGIVDERQMTINYRSGNIAFAAMIVTSVIISIVQSAKGDHSWELFNIVIIVGVASKALFNVLLVKDYKEAGIRIMMSIGMLMVLFAALEEGLSFNTLMNASPGLAIILVSLLARIYPKPVGILIFLATAALEFVILKKGFTIGQIATAVIIGVPMTLAGASLLRSKISGDANQN